MKKPISLYLILALLFAVIFAPLGAEERDETKIEGPIPYEMIQQSLVEGVKYLYSEQHDDGLWYYSTNDMYPIGTTSLVLYALSLAGISPKDTKFQKALRALLEKVDRLSVNDTTTYELGLGILALEIIDRKRFRKEIAKMRGILINRQADSGGWDYRAPSYMQTGNRQQQRTDWSNSQFAILALTAAERAEARGYAYKRRSAPQHWQNLRKYIIDTHLDEGGWPYCPVTANPENLRATDSMTAAAIASALITYAALNHSREFPCGSDRVLLNMVEEGLEWFGERETRVMPTRISSLTSHTTYRMYAKERVGFYTGLRLLGGIDWYNEGTRLIIECNRSAENNGWKDVPGAAFAVMFLSKGRWPIVVQKLKWGDGWNDDALDMLRLTEKASEIFEDKEMERLFTSETAYMPTPRAGKRCTWRTVTFETPFDILMEVPILYIVGKKFPEFSEEQADILERYALSGGTILAVAGCGEKEFDEGLRKFVAEKFSGYEFTVLDRDHPLYSSWYRSSLAYEPLHAIIGPHGRPMILYSEDGISCDWEGGHIDSKESRLGISIIKYISDLVPGIWH